MKVEGEIVTLTKKELGFYLVCAMTFGAFIGFLIGL